MKQDEKQPRSSAKNNADAGFSEEEKAATKARVKEMKAESKKKSNREEGEKELLAALDAMPPEGKAMGQKLHAIISANAPDLLPKTWYGMPAYANKEGKTVLFFRGKEKFKERYVTLGFNQEANLDEGNLWPIVYALTEVGPKEEQAIAELVRKAVT